MMPPTMEGVWLRKGHVGPKGRDIVYARDLAELQAGPHVGMTLHNMVLMKFVE